MYVKRFLAMGFALLMGSVLFFGHAGAARALVSNELESLLYAGPEGDFRLLFTLEFCDDATCADDVLSTNLSYGIGDYLRVRIVDDAAASSTRIFQFSIESGWNALLNGILSITDGRAEDSFNFATEGTSIPAANITPSVATTTFHHLLADPDDSVTNSLD